MQGRQKLLYLPEAHTDMIYAVIGEELGLGGTAVVLLAFLVIFWRGIRAADIYPRWREIGGGSTAPADQRTLQRERLEARAQGKDASAQLVCCFPRWTRVLEQLTSRALERLAANELVDPNDREIWRSRGRMPSTLAWCRT